MVEFPQTVPNLTEASTNLYDLIKSRNLVVYPDRELRKSMSQAIAIESARGWRIAKEKQKHKIDFVVALGMAALGVIHAAGKGKSASAGMLAGGHQPDDPAREYLKSPEGREALATRLGLAWLLRQQQG